MYVSVPFLNRPVCVCVKPLKKRGFRCPDVMVFFETAVVVGF